MTLGRLLRTTIDAVLIIVAVVILMALGAEALESTGSDLCRRDGSVYSGGAKIQHGSDLLICRNGDWILSAAR